PARWPGILRRARNRKARARAPRDLRHRRCRGHRRGALPRIERLPLARQTVPSARSAAPRSRNPAIEALRCYRGAMQRLAIVIGVVGLAALVSAQAQIASYPLPADVTYPEGIAYDAAAN